jgi:calcium-dependent protein kinase
MGCVKSKPLNTGLSVLQHRGIESKKKVIPHPSKSRRNIMIEFEGTTSSRSMRFESKESGDFGNVTISIITSDRCEIESVYDGVHDGEVLGYGIGGIVRLVTHKKTGTQFAVKRLCLAEISEEGLKQICEEVRILMELDHPNIVKLDGVYQTEEEIYLVQELCHGGDLFDRLDAQPEEHYSEAQCARLIKQILCAVRYIHSKGIVHRDLKLENFLFDHEGPDAELKMIDFGLSKHFNLGEIHHEPVGTRYTVAPEVLRGSYDEKVDIWAIGVITYLLLSGDAPFGGCCEGESNVDIRRKILQAEFSFEPEEYWHHISPQAKEFISMLLLSDPQRRPTAEQCQNSDWLREWAHKGNNESKGINSNVISALRNFQKFSEMRKLLCEVIGFTLLPEQMAILREDFEKLDVEQSGEISLKGLKQVLLNNVVSGTLGDFIEEEVEDIFNSLRLHKEDTTIHWHHFLAAGLSEVPLDERNHRLAFDKLDTEGKGYITYEDLVDLLGPEKLKCRPQSFKGQWKKSTELGRTGSRIAYDDFVRMMDNGDVNENQTSLL